MNTLDIVRQYLISHGYDGLVCPAVECGCPLTELAPCEADFSQCEPGYAGVSPACRTGRQGEWAIFTTKAAAIEYEEGGNE